MTIGRVVEMSSSTVPILLAALLEVFIINIAIVISLSSKLSSLSSSTVQMLLAGLLRVLPLLTSVINHPCHHYTRVRRRSYIKACQQVEREEKEWPFEHFEFLIRIDNYLNLERQSKPSVNFV